MPVLTIIIAFMSRSPSNNIRVKALLRSHDVGLAMLQYGQRNSSALISFLQFGQSIALLLSFVICSRFTVQGSRFKVQGSGFFAF